MFIILLIIEYMFIKTRYFLVELLIQNLTVFHN